MKLNIKKYLREKHQIYQFLENLVKYFIDRGDEIGKQEGSIKT